MLQSLIAVDAQDDPRFADRAATPLQALLSFQLGCDVPEADRGAFTYPGSNDAPNGFATAQAVGAAAGAPVLFEPGDLSDGVTPLDCTPVTTTTTTTVAPTTAAPDHRGADDRRADHRGADHRGADHRGTRGRRRDAELVRVDDRHGRPAWR